MIAIDCGQLGEKLIADIIRDAAQRRFDGALRLMRAEMSKSIYFEGGMLVYAISNLPSEQIEAKLIRGQLLTPDLLDAALERNPDPQQLGQTLIDMRVLSEANWHRTVLELIEQIIQSLFEWADGDYLFEDAALPPHATRIQWMGADCVLQNMRRAALIKAVAALIVPPDTVVSTGDPEHQEFVHSARLSPSEGYVLSSIQAPTPVAQVSAMTGLAEEEAHRALCVLLALGALKRSATKVMIATSPSASASIHLPLNLETPPAAETAADQSGAEDRAIAPPVAPPWDAQTANDDLNESLSTASEEPNDSGPLDGSYDPFADEDDWFSAEDLVANDPVADEVAAPAPASSNAVSNENNEADWVLNEVRCKLMQFEIASYYEVLGVDRLATTTTIRQAYYGMEQMFESFQMRWPAHHELNSKLTELFAIISQAYMTLSDPHRRREYDMPASKKRLEQEPRKTNGTSMPVKRVPLPMPAVLMTPPPRPPAPAPQPRPSAPAPQPLPRIQPLPLPQAVAPAPKPLSVDNPVKIAGERYQQGRACYERRDFHTAAHLLREAAKLDPTRVEHHYLLAMTLTVLSQARHMHDGHEGCHVTCNLGGALVRNQRTRYEAVQHFREAAHLDRQNAKIRVHLGLLYKSAGMLKKAEACFWEALMIDGKDEMAMQELGLGGQSEVTPSENPLAQKAARKDQRKKNK